MTVHKGKVEALVRQLLPMLGEKDRPGLAETPERVSKAWEVWCSGYDQDPASVLKTFEDGAEGQDELVIQKGIPFYSHCEHHLAPFFGRVSIGYIPAGKIVGLSKLSRVTNIFARRLQVQERMGAQIADAIQEHLQPLGVGVVVTARHLCMESRGVQIQGTETTTSALRGVFKTDPQARAEFLDLIKE